MKSAFILAVFLACASICKTATIILGCRCTEFSKAVRFDLIKDIQLIEPRPYCSRLEVIVELKDGSLACMETDTEYTNALVLTKRRQVNRNKQRRHAALRSTMRPTQPPTSRPIRTSTSRD